MTSTNVSVPNSTQNGVLGDKTPVVVKVEIGDSISFCKTIEMFLSGAAPTTTSIPLTFDKDGITINEVRENKKKKTNLYMRATFKRYDLFYYSYTHPTETSITLKFEKSVMLDRIKTLKNKDVLGLTLKSGIQAMFLSINSKGEDKMPAIIESVSETTSNANLNLASSMGAIAATSRQNYWDICQAAKRRSSCEAKVEIYSTGLRFFLSRYGERDGSPYDCGIINGERIGFYTLDSNIFGCVSNKILKIANEHSTVKFYLTSATTTARAMFSYAISIGVSGNLTISCPVDTPTGHNV